MLPIRTQRLELRDFVSADFEAVHHYASDIDVTRFLSWGPNDEAETRAFLKQSADEARAQPRLTYSLAIILGEAGDLIGGCGLMSRRAHYQEFEVGYCLRKDAWGQGYASEAVRASVEFGFDRLSAHRIYACVDPENVVSVGLIEKLGFRKEGLLRGDTRVGGRWRDSLIYARLADAREAR